MMSVVRNIDIGQLGYLSGYAPSQLLHTSLLAEYEKLEKVLDFTATNENSSIINILLYQIQNRAATERKINSILAKTRTAL